MYDKKTIKNNSYLQMHKNKNPRKLFVYRDFILVIDYF